MFSFVCVVGLGLIVYADTLTKAGDDDSDSDSDSDNSHGNNDNADNNDSDASYGGVPSNPIKGDLLCLSGAALYALNNVFFEKLCKNYSRVEYLAFIGMFGTLISIVQIYVVEYDDIKHFLHTADIQSVLLILAFVATIVSFYVGVSLFLQTSSAALLNISLLTSDIYATLFQVFVLNVTPSWLYFVAFIVIGGGVGGFNYYDGRDDGMDDGMDDGNDDGNDESDTDDEGDDNKLIHNYV